jgi:hypothetical protein
MDVPSLGNGGPTDGDVSAETCHIIVSAHGGLYGQGIGSLSLSLYQQAQEI